MNPTDPFRRGLLKGGGAAIAAAFGGPISALAARVDNCAAQRLRQRMEKCAHGGMTSLVHGFAYLRHPQPQSGLERVQKGRLSDSGRTTHDRDAAGEGLRDSRAGDCSA